MQPATCNSRLDFTDQPFPSTLAHLTDLNDNPATTSKLFELVNIIADKMITGPKEIDKLFEGLPEGKKEAILKRDGQQ